MHWYLRYLINLSVLTSPFLYFWQYPMNSSWSKTRRDNRVKGWDDVRQIPEDQVQVQLPLVRSRTGEVSPNYQEYPSDEEIKKHGLRIIGRVV
jgi:hypothetical protein